MLRLGNREWHLQCRRIGRVVWTGLSLPHFTCSVVGYPLAKWIVSKNGPLQNLRPVASGIHIQCPCGVIRLHPVCIYRGLETRRRYLTKCNFYRRGKKPSSDYCLPYVLGRCTEDDSEDGVSVILAPSGTDVQEHILHRFLQLTHFCKFCR